MSETIRIGAPPAAPAKRRRKSLVWIAVGIALALGGTAAAVGLLIGDETISVHGQMRITDPDGFDLNAGGECAGDGGYTDIHAGTQVVITDRSGATVAVGQLGRGSRINSYCELPFNLDVPGGSDFYGIEVSHRGVLQYPRDRLVDPLVVTLG